MTFFLPLRPLLKGWALSFFGWSLVGLAMAAQGVTSRGDGWLMHLEPSMRAWLPWAILTPLLFRLVSRLPLGRPRWRLAVPVHVLCCVAVMTACQWWKSAFSLQGFGLVSPGFKASEGFSRRDPDRKPGLPGRGPEWRQGGNRAGPSPGFLNEDRPPLPPGEDWPGERPAFSEQGLRRGHWGGAHGSFEMLLLFSLQLPIYLMIVTGAHAAYFFRRDQQRAASLAGARLEALRMQLQPHFLFNALNTIAGLVHEQPDKADAMLTSLSELLRLSLETGSAQQWALSRELQFVERYLAIMHVRFEERLRFELDVDPRTEAAQVPPMLLQPLVENAIEHGLQPKPEGGCVSVRTWLEGGTLHLSVRDDGVGMPDGGPLREGVGISNTRARLRELYEERASLCLRNGTGVTVEISLPFRTTCGNLLS